MLKVRTIIILYLILVIIFNLPSKKLDKLNERMEQRGKINNLLVTLCFRKRWIVGTKIFASFHEIITLKNLRFFRGG